MVSSFFPANSGSWAADRVDPATRISMRTSVPFPANMSGSRISVTAGGRSTTVPPAQRGPSHSQDVIPPVPPGVPRVVEVNRPRGFREGLRDRPNPLTGGYAPAPPRFRFRVATAEGTDRRTRALPGGWRPGSSYPRSVSLHRPNHLLHGPPETLAGGGRLTGEKSPVVQTASIRTSMPPVRTVSARATGKQRRITSPSTPSWSITAAALMIFAGATPEAIPLATAWAA